MTSLPLKKFIKDGLSSQVKRMDRFNTQVELRRNKRIQCLSQKRIKTKDDSWEGYGGARGGAGGEAEEEAEGGEVEPEKERGELEQTIQDAMKEIHSEDIHLQKKGLKTINTIVTYYNDDTLEDIVSIMVDLNMLNLGTLLDSDNVDIVYDILVILSNAALSEMAHAVVDHGILEKTITLIQHSTARIRDQAVWCISNAIGGNVHLRDTVLSKDEHTTAIKYAIKCAEETEHISNLAWLICNLCMGNPLPKTNIVTHFLIPAIGSLWFDNTNAMRTKGDISYRCLQAIKHLTSRENEYIQLALDWAIFPTVFQFLTHLDAPLTIAEACAIIVNVASGTAEQSTCVRNTEVWDMLAAVLTYDLPIKIRQIIEKEMALFLSNVLQDMDNNDPLYCHDLILKVLSVIPSTSSKVVHESSYVIRVLTLASMSPETTAASAIIRTLLDNGMMMESIKRIIALPDTTARLNGLASLVQLCESRYMTRVIAVAEEIKLDQTLIVLSGHTDAQSQALLNRLFTYFEREEEGDYDDYEYER